MKTMTLNLSDTEMQALDTLARQAGMSKTGALRQALRLYQLVSLRTLAGWEMDFVDESGKSHRQVMAKAMLGTGPLPLC